MRHLAPEKYRALKAKVRTLVTELGGQEAGEEFTRVGHQTLSDYCNFKKPTSFMPADVILDLELTAGSPIVTRHLARAQNYELVPVVAASGPVIDSQMIGRIAREFGDVMERAGSALADDGKISRIEISRHQLIDQLNELIGEACAVRNECQKRIEAPE